MAKTFDIYKDDKVVQAGVPSPVEIDNLAPNTQYDEYSAAYAGKPDKTPLSFKTAVQAVTGVMLDKTTLALETGATATVKPTIAPSDATDKAFTFSSADTKIATVDNNGKITAIKAGKVDITVTTHDGAKTAKVTVTITDPVVKMTGFDLDSYELTGETGENGTVTVSNVKPANTTDVVVNAVPEDSSIVTVKDNGDATFTITYVKAGTTKVVFTAHDGSGVLHNLTVTVADPVVKVNSFKVGDGSLKLTGETSAKSDEFTITDILPANATSKDIAFTSSDESIVTVASTGSYKYQATYVKVGTAKLTFSSKDGGAHYDIDVVVADPAPEG